MKAKIDKIEVKELFGFLNHKVHLNDEGVTFIHGPNGCGKTTFLKLIASTFEWDLDSLIRTNFRELKITFKDGRSLDVEKIMKPPAKKKKPIPTLVFSLIDNQRKVHSFETTFDEDLQSKYRAMRDLYLHHKGNIIEWSELDFEESIYFKMQQLNTHSYYAEKELIPTTKSGHPKNG